MSEDLLIAVIASGSAMLGPILLTWANQYARIQDKKEIKAKLDDQIKTVTARNTKIDEIHALVNSAMTDTMQTQLDGNLRELDLMREIARLRGELDPEQEAKARLAIALAQQRVDDLREALRLRHDAAPEPDDI